MKISSVPSKKTTSVCPVCLRRIPAKLAFREGSWYLEKTCDEHGSFQAVVWRGTAPDLRQWGNYNPPKEAASEAPDCPNECGLCGKHLQSTCCVLVEVTSRCNLKCPVCFAASSLAPEKSVEELFHDFEYLAAKGCRFIQLSGGEPTVRNDLPDIVAVAKKTGATSVQLNSNGLRLGREPEFTKRLAESGLDFVFLQFDGISDEPYRALRGEPLLAEKLEAIRICGENGIGVTLVPTVVPGVNDHQIGDILLYGIKNTPVIRGVHFQPISYFGRYPSQPADAGRITLPEIAAAIETQTDGMIRLEDLAPSACDHPRCGFHGDFMILPDKLISLQPKMNPEPTECCCGGSDQEALRNRNFVARRWKRNLEREQEAEALEPRDPSELMDLDTFLSRVAANGFTVTSMAFQDAYTLDIERLRRCSLHVYDHGRIIPFCARYLTSSL